MPRHKTGQFDQTEYIKAYHREHTKYRKMSLNNANPEDIKIMAWLDSRPEGVSAYLKRLVKEDMGK